MPATARRQLLVIADDFGIGPNTTAGILQLGVQGIVTGSALIVNTPYTVDAIRQWYKRGAPIELGWHPNLTLDTPIAPATEIPSLVQPDGTFWPLPMFLKRWFLGLFEPREIDIEWRAQLERFTALVGHPPRFVNCHQHIALFSPIGEILLHVLGELPVRPYFRRVQEPWALLRTLPTTLVKRTFLGWLGRRFSRMAEAHGFPGNDWLAGIASPDDVLDPEFFVQWLRAMPGNVVELMCHPGRLDPTLVGRDCTSTDGLLQQRVNELRWLRDPTFLDAAGDAGFQLTAPSQYIQAPMRLARCA